jgi:hypothetical protein
LKVPTYFAWEIQIVNAIHDVSGYFFYSIRIYKHGASMTETRLKKSHVRNFVKKFSNSSYWAINLINKIYKNKKSREESTISFPSVSPSSF